jgi:CxxC motif-containing protein
MIDEENDYNVTGNSCPKGVGYGKEELINPTRVVTSTVRVEGGIHAMVPVKTNKPVPKSMTFDVVEELKKVRVQAPKRVGAVVVENVLGTGADIILTRDI